MKAIVALFCVCLCLAVSGNASAETPKSAERVTVEIATRDVLAALAARDFGKLASYIGQDGLRVSPYVFLDDDDVRLSRAEVEGCKGNPQVRLWGHRDGSANPIETACKSYFDEFVWNADYRKADEVLYNEPRQRGNEVNNNHDVVPGSTVVELHVRGRGDQKAMNWKSLRLIFRKTEQGLFLIAITRDVWTI